MDLFTVFLNSLIGNALDWAVGRILDVRTKCPLCAQERSIHLGNRQGNELECSNCQKVASQFTNACDFTVNKATRQIGHSKIKQYGEGWNWETEKAGLFARTSFLEIPIVIVTDGLDDRTLVVESSLRRYGDDHLITGKRSVVVPSWNKREWGWHGRRFAHVHRWPASAFSAADTRDVITCDLRIMSEFKDILSEHRAVIRPWKA